MKPRGHKAGQSQVRVPCPGTGPHIPSWRWPVRRALRLVAVLALVLTVACADEPAAPPVPASATLWIVHPTVSMLAVGDTIRLAVEVRDRYGQVVEEPAVAWSSQDPRVAEVGPEGVVTAVAPGTARITATAGGTASGTVQLSVSDPQYAVLWALYSSTGGHDWTRSDNWVSDGTLGDWYGVVTDSAGRVTGLDLSSNNLVGGIPPELGDLSHLKALDLGFNSLTGEISTELGDLSELDTLDLGFNSLTGPIPVELGGLSKLNHLDLRSNDLTGPIPAELGGLSELTNLYLWGNHLTGRIPAELGALSDLNDLDLRANDLTGPIPAELGGLSNLNDLDLSANDLTGPIPAELGALSNLIILDLSANDLTGSIPIELGGLQQLIYVRLSDNALTGAVPRSFVRLPILSTFEFTGNDGLCAPGTSGFSEWAAGLGQGFGGPFCNHSDRDALEQLYETAGGSGWTDSDGWLGSQVLNEWHGVTADSLGRVVTLDLTRNGLSGRLPARIGELGAMTSLQIGANELSGRLPLSLAGLPLAELRYAGTALCAPADESFQVWLGEITSHEGTGVECGPLSDREILEVLYEATGGPDWTSDEKWLTNAPLREWHGVTADAFGQLVGLNLNHNGLAGRIPPELGHLTNLYDLRIGSNELGGPIPSELGNLTNLQHLYLQHNELTGPVPPEFGGLWRLRGLGLSGNASMSGELPDSLTALSHLETLSAGGTRLCAPADTDFLEWLERLSYHRVVACESSPAAAYLVQAAQSREFPVPLVAGRQALLRVFVSAAESNRERLPAVRASFYLGDTLRYVADIPSKPGPISTDVYEGSLTASVNRVIPGEVVQPGLEMVIDVDPAGALDPDLGVVGRIPNAGRIAVDVSAMPVLDLTVIPLIWSWNPDSSVVDLAEEMAANPQGHRLLSDTRSLLPVNGVSVTARAPLTLSSNSSYTALDSVKAIRSVEAMRVMEGGTGHYMGMMASFASVGGRAQRPGWSSVSVPNSSVIAHELGHNMNLMHAPCGRSTYPSNVDPAFPYRDGSIGSWGYDSRGAGNVVSPRTPDLMSYCGPPDGASDYHFTKALNYRLVDEGDSGSPMVAEPTTSLLLWGGVDAGGTPFLDPAFVVDAPPALPDSGGEYMITGSTASGEGLFSLSFAMPELADGDGSSSFVFALPASPGWEGRLATITLSGPAGSATLDGNTDRPMAILRDPGTGHVRAILRDFPEQARAQADAVGALGMGPGLETFFSRGIPDGEAWRR